MPFVEPSGVVVDGVEHDQSGCDSLPSCDGLARSLRQQQRTDPLELVLAGRSRDGGDDVGFRSGSVAVV